MEQSVFEPLSEITQALKEGKVHSKQARTYLTKCIDHLMNLTVNIDSEIQDVLRKYIPIFDQLILLLPDGVADKLYYRSIAALIQGDYPGYIMESERFYAAKSAEAPDWLDWIMADQYFISIWTYLPVLGDWNEEYFPSSAFDLYCKFWLSKGSDQYRLRLLRNILEKDPQWAWAWAEIGSIKFNIVISAQVVVSPSC